MVLTLVKEPGDGRVTAMQGEAEPMSWSREVTVGGSGQGGHSGHGIKWTDCRCVHREGAGLNGAKF